MNDDPAKPDPAKPDPSMPEPATSQPARAPHAASPKLIEALVCPASGTRLEYDAAAGELISKAAGLAYPIRDGIPIMLIDEARRIED